MHFFYVDEAGCTGDNLADPDQPIFVLGGISVRDEGWMETNRGFDAIIREFFAGHVPEDFELHTHQLINMEGSFAGYERADVNSLILRLLDLIVSRGHAVHFVAIDKQRMLQAIDNEARAHQAVRTDVPYLLGFNYLVSYIEKYVRKTRGHSARGMIILDIKEGFQEDIDAITNFRRYHVPKKRRLKWLVEFSYPVDSARHPMIQLSDLVVYMVKKFLEVDIGHKPNATDEAKRFFALCYEKIIQQKNWVGLIDVPGDEEAAAHRLLAAANATHKKNWRKTYGI